MSEYIAYPGTSKALAQGCTCKGYDPETDDILINVKCWVHMGKIIIGTVQQEVLYLYDGVGNYDAKHGLYEGPRLERMTAAAAYDLSVRRL